MMQFLPPLRWCTEPTYNQKIFISLFVGALYLIFFIWLSCAIIDDKKRHGPKKTR